MGKAAVNRGDYGSSRTWRYGPTTDDVPSQTQADAMADMPLHMDGSVWKGASGRVVSSITVRSLAVRRWALVEKGRAKLTAAGRVAIARRLASVGDTDATTS